MLERGLRFRRIGLVPDPSRSRGGAFDRSIWHGNFWNFKLKMGILRGNFQLQGNLIDWTVAG
jgi:hypothetical protein